MTRRAFTLIELLVVVAIISLLVSILLPSLRAAQDLAREVGCASSLHNMGIAVGFHAHDHDGTLVGGAQGSGLGVWSITLIGGGYIEGVTWYMPKPELMCPSNTVSWMEYGNPLTSPSSGGMSAGGLGWAGAETRYAKYADVPYAAQTPHLCEMAMTRGGVYAFKMGYCPGDGVVYGDHMWGIYNDLHREGSNVLFVDSRVQWVPADEWWERGPYAGWSAPTVRAWGYHFSLNYLKPTW